LSFLFGGRPKANQPQAAAAITIQQSSYGTPVYLLYGTNRIYGNLIWYGAFTSTLVSVGGGGGKGGVVGGGGKGGGSSEYNYSASFAIGLCEGPVAAIGAVYVTKQISSLGLLNGVLFEGTQGQAPWGYLTTSFPDQALGYTELAYVGFPNFSLGTSSETPQFSFETSGLKVIGSGNQDASPDQIIIDFLERCGVPASYVDTFSDLATYCTANGFFISPLIDQQRQASEWLKEWMGTLNSEFVWLPSQGVLSAVPYGDTAVSGNGVTYIPNLTPQYQIGDDDLIHDGDSDPITCTRTDAADVYNQVPIEFVNRGDQYNVDTYQAFDDSLIDLYGVRTAPTLRAHHVTDQILAQTLAQLWMNRQIFVRCTYEFKLPWNYILLDPMDIIGLTDANLGLSNTPVRIVSIEEDEKDGMLTFKAEEIPGAVGTAIVNPNFGPTRYVPNYNLDPGIVNPPVFFETPLALLQAAAVEVDIAISGLNPLWGGCNVWVSTDGVTYQYLAQFLSKSRMGVLTADLSSFTPLPNSNNIDTASLLEIDMAESDGELNNAATETDATALNTVCYVDGELIAFGNDVLTGTNQYTLSYLNRGCYGSTIGAHAIGSAFARLDAGIFRYDANQAYINTTMYFKFCSFNVWGGGLQTLDEVAPYTYKILGLALLTPLANPDMLSVSYNQFLGQLNWTAVADIRTPIYYEVRKGSDFISASVVGVTSETSFDVYGSDTYWVTALYYTPTGVPVYSSSPPSIVVTTPSVPLNLIETYDEAAHNFPGTCSGGATYLSLSNVVELATSDILTDTDVIVDSDVLASKGVVSPGTYTSTQTFTSNYVANCKVMIDYSLAGENVNTGDIITTGDVITVQDILDGVSQALVRAQPQINLSTNGGSTYQGWQNWVPGFYTFNAIQFRIILISLSSQVTAVLSQLSYTVDVPQLTQTGSLSTAGGGSSTVTFTNKFNAVPIVNAQIVNAVAGDLVVMGTPTETGFTIGVVNGGSNVVRVVAWTATAW